MADPDTAVQRTGEVFEAGDQLTVLGRRLAAGVLAGLAAFATVWGFLSAPTKGPSIAEDFIRLTPRAHGKDVVTVIITDFRGLDTLAEITVLLIAGVAVATLLRKGRLW